MDPHLQGILLPHLIVLFHVDALDPVQRHHVKLPHRFVVLRRIPRRHDDPSLRHPLVSKSLALKELQHGRRQRLRDAVDLIDEQDPFPKPGLLHLLIDRSDDLAHGVLRHLPRLSPEGPLLDKRQTDGALPGVVSDGVGHKADTALPGHLLHDLGLADPRRPHEKHRPLTDGGDHILPVSVLCKIRLNGIFDFLFRSFNMHKFLLFLLPKDLLPTGSA